MLTFTHLPETNIIELHLTGKLTAEDYESVEPALERLIDEYGAIRMVVEIHDLAGMEPRAFWDDLKFSIKHRNHISHFAIVGDKKWIEWWTRLAGAFAPADVHYFDSGHLDAARVWIADHGA